MNDCRFGVSPVNYPDPETSALESEVSLFYLCFTYGYFYLILNGNIVVFYKDTCIKWM